MSACEGEPVPNGVNDMATAAITESNLTLVRSRNGASCSPSAAGTRIFRSLKQRETEDLLASGSTYRVTRGRIVYYAGDVLQHLYLVESGSIKIIRSSEEGKELIVGLVGPGECFGSMAYAQPTGSLAQALEDSRIFLIPHQSLRRIAAANPSFGLDLLKMSEQLFLDTQAAAARLAFDTVPHRLAQLLITLSDPRYGTLKYPVNQTEIANLIGSSRETVCSILSRLRRDGLLSIVKGRIRILRPEQLSSVR
jgi:CRP/FNR family transcriptional regulator